MRALAVQVARDFLGTPFVEGASVAGAGCDCAGLIEAIARAAGLEPPDRAASCGDLGRAARDWLLPVDPPCPGDIILLARDCGGEGVHAAVMSAPDRIIHAHWSRGVVENRLSGWFLARRAAAFTWPNQSSSFEA